MEKEQMFSGHKKEKKKDGFKKNNAGQYSKSSQKK